MFQIKEEYHGKFMKKIQVWFDLVYLKIKLNIYLKYLLIFFDVLNNKSPLKFETKFYTFWFSSNKALMLSK